MSVRARLRAPGTAADYDAVLPAPFGAVGIRADAGGLHELVFLADCAAQAPRNPAAARVAAEVADYLAGRRAGWSAGALPAGTPFRQRVWAAIAAIPRGTTRTYGELAHDLGSAPRAVGQACGDNPLPLIIPCHRVVAASGAGGFAHSGGGFHLRVKTWLLAHEARC